jgi:hypothetical protein
VGGRGGSAATHLCATLPLAARPSPPDPRLAGGGAGRGRAPGDALPSTVLVMRRARGAQTRRGEGAWRWEMQLLLERMRREANAKHCRCEAIAHLPSKNAIRCLDSVLSNSDHSASLFPFPSFF